MFWDDRGGGLAGQLGPQVDAANIRTKLMVGASPRALGPVKDFSFDCMFWDDRGGGLAGQPMGPQVDTANIRTVLSTNHVDSRSFSSRCWAFRRTHPSADPIRYLVSD